MGTGVFSFGSSPVIEGITALYGLSALASSQQLRANGCPAANVGPCAEGGVG